MLQTKQLGNNGEKAVARYLEKQGYNIVAQNYRTRCGEIDVIACKKEVIAFVEVKTRKKNYFPIASVITKSKQRKIIKTAKSFILNIKKYIKIDVTNKVFRFDVAIVLEQNNRYEIKYLSNAFTQE